jgi:CheY-like chemotaxis protein
MDQASTSEELISDHPIVMGAPPASVYSKAERLEVLLVEDDEADAYLIKHVLTGNTRIGKVVLAKDGVEALEFIDSGLVSPDLAIVDLHMPRKDGFSLLRDFAARENAAFPAVVLTSSRSGADSLRSRKRGAGAFLTKPNTVEKLAYALDEVISNI